ncbi:phosphorylase [Methylobacterium nigriterrae]|uniref:phosphorylase n=1 Tax=Methylobacterium nigriterrae TaxID=3127512 RepID=UPI0030133A3D
MIPAEHAAHASVADLRVAGPLGPPVLAVTGMAKEARIASGPGVTAIGAGGNTQRLRALLADRLEPGCRAVVSIGIAGGLDPGLVPGDIVVASGVVADRRRFAVDPVLAEALLARLAKPGVRAVAGDLAGVDTAVLSLDGKADLRAGTNALAVDMESHAAAIFAERHALPFAAIRVVCDPAHRALPAFAAKALKPDGEPDIRVILAALARDPGKLSAIIRLARDSSAAFSALARARALLGAGLGMPAAAEPLHKIA